MKPKSIPRSFGIVVATCLCLIAMPQANAAITILDEGLNNTGNSSTIGSASGSSGKAINFVMPAGQNYTLSQIILGLGDVQNNETPLVQIWSDDGSSAPIGTLLHTLTNPSTLTNGQNTFTSSGFTLTANTPFWVVVRSTSGNFDWLGKSNDWSTTGIASHTARLFGTNSSGAGNWNSTSTVLNQIQISAVPEPNTALAGLLLTVGMLSRRRRA